MPKRALRTDLLARRRGLPALDAQALSLELQQRFLALPEFRAAASIAFYSPIHNEVDVKFAAQQALLQGKRVLFPRVVQLELEFCPVAALADLVPGRFGILEPHGPASDPRSCDLIVVPGVAFDLYGRRIGYGKGFYDRALHQMEGSGRLVGFCYQFQLLPEIVGEPHDVTMDLLVTEQRVVRVNNNIESGGTRQ